MATVPGKPSRGAKPQARAVGRPRTGKRSDPDYRQVSAWIKRDTYEKVTLRLFTKENRREFSDLVQDLLAKWLRA
jgi:hypothetical protein